MRPRSLNDDMLAAGVKDLSRTGSRELEVALEKLRGRLELLPTNDRKLVELVFTGQMTLRNFAALTGQDPGTLSRRQRQLWRRLNHPILDLLFSRQLSDVIPPEYRQLGIEHFLLGLTMCELADKHQITKTQVQQMLGYLQGVADTHTSRR